MSKHSLAASSPFLTKTGWMSHFEDGRGNTRLMSVTVYTRPDGSTTTAIRNTNLVALSPMDPTFAKMAAWNLIRSRHSQSGTSAKITRTPLLRNGKTELGDHSLISGLPHIELKATAQSGTDETTFIITWDGPGSVPTVFLPDKAAHQPPTQENLARFLVWTRDTVANIVSSSRLTPGFDDTARAWLMKQIMGDEDYQNLPIAEKQCRVPRFHILGYTDYAKHGGELRLPESWASSGRPRAGAAS